ncbi:hypothetical protein S40285_04430 [Stachybotrys chlorohalonatus IBT 40285]|uniref:NAD-dependent epimerase/dehydratase domain-containing protein n=1 Tax=Stachybotrys chlorohalonatus (strain IBT 40285) TaxID=1283841 RepID=A0A084R1Y8_STAC4|nr:hypothetical protein S40285_04430 [Stachybotrys chlorohalonata IBT 40285]
MPVVPPNGLILVTGANGYIASVAIKVFLEEGYSVRGTVRSTAKHEWMLAHFGPKFSLAEVPDISADGAFTEVMKGVDGVAHMAADVSLSNDSSIVEKAVKAVVNVLEAAANEPSVKSVALTSSFGACAATEPGVPYKIDSNTWNDYALEQFRRPEGELSLQDRTKYIYGSAKVSAERGAHEWVKEHKPHYTFNSVVPNLNFGTVVAPAKLGMGSTGTMIPALARGIPFGPAMKPAPWAINTEDTALLHLAALTLDGVENERLFAFGFRFTWNEMVEVLLKHYASRTKVSTTFDHPPDLGDIANQRAEELLRRLGKPGFRGLEETVVANMEVAIEAESIENLPRTRFDDLMDMMTKKTAVPAAA